MKTVLSVIAIFACFAAAAERQPLDRYQPIIDRQMFGQPPPNFDPTRPASEVPKGGFSEKELTKEQAALKSSIHFSVINVTPDGATAVGFTDNADPKVPVHYYLKVGEERNGWKVVEADPIAATMKIAKGDVEVALDLGANSAKGGGATARAGGPEGGSRAGGLLGGRRGGLLGGRNVAAPEGGDAGVSRLGSLRERRAAREKEREAEAAEKEKAEKERAAEREAERAARDREEKEREAERAAEREEQRRALQSLQEELKAQREERARMEREAEQRSEDAEDNN